MKRALLVAALVVSAGMVWTQAEGTQAGLVDTEQAGGSFTADLCDDSDCKIVHADSLEGYDCNPDEWHFTITQTSPEQAPGSIHVIWEDADAAVGLERVTGKVAHYRTSSYLDQQVEDATARIHEDWDGRFNLGEGPCQS